MPEAALLPNLHPSPAAAVANGDGLGRLSLVALTHREADVALREAYALTPDALQRLAQLAHAQGLTSLLALSTCNRTELLAHDADPHQLLQLLAQASQQSPEPLLAHARCLQGREAARHLFAVAAGLDAQILGDVQVVKQVKEALAWSQHHHLADARLHRLMALVLRAHKRIRRETDLGAGAASIAHAAVQCVQAERAPNGGLLEGTRVLLLGAGKIGSVACRNLVALQPRQLVLMNRTHDRALELARAFGDYPVAVAPWDDLARQVAWADVVVVATGAPQPVLLRQHLQCPVVGPKTLLDLSVPRNIDPQVRGLRGIRLVDLDELQAVTDDAFARRQAAVPQAWMIVEHELAQFVAWSLHRRHAPLLHELQQQLLPLLQQELPNPADAQRVLNRLMAVLHERLRERDAAC